MRLSTNARGSRMVFSAVLTALMILVPLAQVSAGGQGEQSSTAARPDFVSIGTASAAGAYYPLGVAMASVWNRAISGTRFSAQETGGGVANMNMLQGKEIELGIANENIAFDAILGNPPFTQRVDTRGGWVMNDSMAVVVALRDSGITRVADLRGKRVALGAPGSSANVFGQLILKAEGIEEGEYTATYMGWQESADALLDGFVDAALMVGGQPFPAIESLAVRAPVTVLRFDTERFRQLSVYPYTGGIIPASMYRTAADGDAVVIRSIIYLDPSLPEDLVYEMVKAIFENIPALAAAHPSGSQARVLSRSDAEQISLQMHPGAIRYAREVGAWE